MELITNDLEVTSLQIAEWSGKNHTDVLRGIRKMFKSVGIGESNFTSTYLDSQNKNRILMVLPKNELLFVTSKYSDKLRWSIIQKISELEHKVNIPQEMIEQFVPNKGFMSENKKGMLKTKPIRGYWRVDKDTEENRLLHRRYELSKIASGLIDLSEEMKLIDTQLENIKYIEG